MKHDTRPFDRALFLHEQQISQDDQDHDPDAVVKKRRYKTESRAGQGNQINWKLHLTNASGYHNVPDRQLATAKKQSRSKSVRAAAIRRTQRRNDTGNAIHYGMIAWKRLGLAKRDQFDQDRNALAFIGPRWDAYHDFRFYSDGMDGGQHLDHLFRSGTAKARPRQIFDIHLRETGSRQRG